MLVHHLKSPDSGVDIEQMVATLEEPVDPQALATAWQTLTERHEVFRTRYEWAGLDAPRALVEPTVRLPWHQEDWRNLEAATQRARLDAYLSADRRRGFDPGAAPLARAAWFQLADARSVFVWTFHHMLADGQSYPALLNEGFALYDAARRGDQVPASDTPPFSAFTTWLSRHLTDQADEAAAFWRARLGRVSAPTPLPFLRTADAGDRADHQERTSTLDEASTTALTEFARHTGVTLNTLVQAAWALVLHGASGEDSVVFGVTRAGRRNTVPDADRIVGACINTVPVGITIAHDTTLSSWLRAIRADDHAVRPFEHTPLTEVQKASQVPAGTPLFHSLIVFTPRLIGARMREQGGAWLSRHVTFHEQTAFPVTLFGYAERQLTLKLAYDARRVGEATIERWLEQLRTILQAMPAAADQPLGALTRIGEAERTRILDTWNQTRREYERSSTVHALIERQVERTPRVTAVTYRDQQITYHDLDRQASALAGELRRRGVTGGDVVGVFIDRSINMVVALVGILKAGAAYLPLDPAFPQERLGWMLEDTAAPVIVTDARLASALPAHRAQIVTLPLAVTAAPQPAAEAPAASPEDLAYVIFTSGSTGRPKGVMVRHRNVTNFFAGMDDAIGGRRPGAWLAVTSISFDISVLELFWTLSRGFTVVLQEDLEASAANVGQTPSSQHRPLDFGLFYFSADAREDGLNRYRLLIEGAKYADAHGFCAVWTPERHFHEFGGLYPNPAVTSAAVAAVTSRIQVRAGSVVLPLHNPIRVAEEWAMVDNLSGGRVELSFASGWHTNDFALMPSAYERRREIMSEGIETIRRLWRGDTVPATNGHGHQIDVRIYPAPRQKQVPVWIAAAGNPDTFRMAGRMGARMLTNLLGQTVEELTAKIAAYRAAWREAGHPGDGRVALMLHTFVGRDLAEVRQTVRKPLIEYLKTSTELVKQARWEFPAFVTHGKRQGPLDNSDLSDAEVDAMMEHAFERYFETSGLFGTPDSCMAMVDRVKGAGVDEVACLMDFGIPTDDVLASLTYLNQLRERSQPVLRATDDYSIPAQLTRHRVTHLQGTPSLIRTILADPDGRRGLGTLDVLLVGGEPLPQALAAELRSILTGDLLNMYGPTETTVWSTFDTVTDPDAITIGRPIANTQIYLVDRRNRPVPLGATGELLIGGDGVTAGYWTRADLSAERFVPNPCVPGATDVVYRTGDLARYREDGRIEFLGRVDHQVKIRGHRIELGEIESAIGQHAAVQQTAVVVKTEAGKEPRLVAYVVPRTAEQDAVHPARAWHAVWDETYRAATTAGVDPTFDISGWRSSYTGDLLPESDMREWVQHTVDRIMALAPTRVLEIGCGTGLLLHAIAPRVGRYTGLDFSSSAVDTLRARSAARGLTNVSLHVARADNVDQIADIDPVDVVVINSVSQYFPDVDYLRRVLALAVARLAPGGAVFVGDVRSLPLLEAFHASVELSQAPATVTVTELAERVRSRVDHDPELVIDPAFFDALRTDLPAVTAVDIQLKRGHAQNEMTRFRYDVVLHTRATPVERPSCADEDASRLGVDEIIARIRSKPDGLCLSGVPNSRVTDALAIVQRLHSPALSDTVAGLRETLGAMPAGIDPEALWQAAGPVPIAMTWNTSEPGRFDVWTGTAGLEASRQRTGTATRAWSSYVHRASLDSGQLIQDLKQHLRAQLPGYMMPGAFVVLDRMPLTPNGKIDRKALPEPDRERQETGAPFVAPGSAVEQTIAAVWRDLLGLDRVGAHDNFFDIGANSLLMVQAHSALRQALDRPLSLVDLFRFPTVSALASHLNPETPVAETLTRSQDRARTRLDAQSRRRPARDTGRPIPETRR